MTKKLTIAMCVAAATCLSAMADSPVARKKSVVESGNARITVLTPEMVRIEYSTKGVFEDRATFSVINRDLPTPKFKKKEDAKYLYIDTDKLSLRYRKGTDPRTGEPADSNLVVTMSLNGTPVTWMPGMKDEQNLKGTTRTLDGSNGDNKRREMEDGILSRSGWSIIDDSPSAKRGDGSRSFAFEPQADGVDWVAKRADEDAMDVYFMGYGHDYKRALYDFTRIAGKIPLPPEFVFGYWYSQYAEYSADEFRAIAKALKDNDFPADVLILDMDWHWNGRPVSDGRGGWTGWSWNTNLIPDPEGLLSDIHSYGLRSALNLHPADGVRADEDFYAEIATDMGMDPAEKKTVPWALDDHKFYKTFFKNIIRAREKQGVDFWWLDWQQHLTNNNIEGLGETFWCNHVFFNEMKNSRKDRRPIIFHRWGGLGCHRYQIGFSGDTHINFPTLAFQPYFTATASNVGYAYWGHDLGGHCVPYDDPNDEERFLRWVQFGVFSPIFRTHATKDSRIERRMWVYPNASQFRDAAKLRYSLIPYIYTMARKTYDTGVGMARPLYYEHPEIDEAYQRENEYYFGDDILVAPIVERSNFGTSHKNIWLPEGEWWLVCKNKAYKGGTYDIDFTLDEIPYFIRRGAIIPRNPAGVKHAWEHPETLELTIVSGPEGKGELYEDAGDSNDYDTAFARTRFTQKLDGNKGMYTIGARKGNYDGMKATRGYVMHIYDTAEPVSATCDGKQLSVKYDADSRCTTVTLPSADCSKERVVNVEYK